MINNKSVPSEQSLPCLAADDEEVTVAGVDEVEGLELDKLPKGWMG
jgi:hypothetical protein